MSLHQLAYSVLSNKEAVEELTNIYQKKYTTDKKPKPTQLWYLFLNLNINCNGKIIKQSKLYNPNIIFEMAANVMNKNHSNRQQLELELMLYRVYTCIIQKARGNRNLDAQCGDRQDYNSFRVIVD